MKQSSKTRVACGCSKGFTLIELMIVVSIIGILATMAVPIYRDRVIRAQVEEGLALAAMAQRAVEEFRDKTGFVPGDNKTAGLPAGEKIIGNYVTRVDVIGGAVNVHFGNRVHRDIKEKILTLRPAVVSDEKRVPIAWVCGYAQGVSGMHVIGVNQTNLLHQELPIDCRI